MPIATPRSLPGPSAHRPIRCFRRRFASVAVLVSGLIGAYHAGVEYHWWQGMTACTGTARAEGVDPLQAILDAPLVRCDQAAWTLFGISLAGWNFLVSTASAIAIFVLLRRKAP